jgi:hypothetical protein
MLPKRLKNTDYGKGGGLLEKGFLNATHFTQEGLIPFLKGSF